MGNFHPHGDSLDLRHARAAWRRTSTCATRWSTARATSARSTATRPPAMRYTEARLDALADELMADLDKETVDFAPNYDETTEEPTVLPAPFPNLLVNGSAGIAVGMATNIPPHNLREVIDGCIWADRTTREATADEKLRRDPGSSCPVRTSRPAASSSAATGSPRPTRPAAARSRCARGPRSRRTRRATRCRSSSPRSRTR